MSMGDDALLRYSRQILLPQIDVAGQQKIVEGRVLIVGLGGLGSPVAIYLAAAGVGHLVLTDFDTVDLSNLQRQIVHSHRDIGRPKVASARDRLVALNPTTEITSLDRQLLGRELQQQVASADVVVDCSDNIATRHALNRVCYEEKKPLVSAAAIGFEGQISVFDFRQQKTPCYACLYPQQSDENLTCSESGVIAPLVGVIGSLQALECLKLLADIEVDLAGKLLLFDGLSTSWQTLSLPKRKGCPVCGEESLPVS